MAIKGYHVLRRTWKSRKPVWWLMLCEFPLVVATLILYGIAQPDVFRTFMWRIGYAEKLNSNPDIILYAFANHRPMPKIPFVWSQSLTELNVAISVIALFVLLAKLVAYIMRLYYPIIAVFVNLVMTGLFAASVGGQAGPDYADQRYPSPVPWYLSKSCSIAAKYNGERTCMIVKGTFAATVLFLAVYVAHLGWSIYNMFGDGLKKRPEGEEEEDGGEGGGGNGSGNGNGNNSLSSSPADDKQQAWEMQPQTPRGVPFTPRTQAFHTLDRKLPLRHQYA